MVSVGERFSGVVVEGVGQDPVGGVVRDRVSNPLDVVEELTTSPSTIVLRIDDAFDEVLGTAVDDEGRRRRLFAVVEGVGEFGLELRNVENGMDADGRRKLEGERHGGGLGNDEEGADFLFR